jgi:hypothetical protein
MQKIAKNVVLLGLILLVAMLAAGYYAITGAANAAGENQP